MVVRKLSFPFVMLAFSLLGTPSSLAADDVVVVSDEYADWNGPTWDETESLDQVIPAQFQSRSGAGNAGASRTSTRQAGLAGGNQRNVQISQLRLANTPKMMGDFFNLPGQSSIVGELFTGNGLHEGLAIHQPFVPNSPFGGDNIVIITIDDISSKAVFLGGSGSPASGTFFEPPIPVDQLQNPQTQLRLDGDNVNFYTAVLTGDVVDVFENSTEPTPLLPEAPVYQMFQVTEQFIPGPNVADIVGRVRVQDNNGTIPQDRVFFDYNYFHNVPFTANGIDVNRFTPGVEKTFWNGMGSIDVRVPMGVTYNSNQIIDSVPDTSATEFGNVTLITKFLLTSNDDCALAAGMAVALPTADDFKIYSQTGSEILSIDNDSVHLVPYLAFLYAPRGSDCFFQSFVTVDVDTNGNPVFGNLGTNDLEELGTWNDQTLVSASGTVGKYLYQNYSRQSRLQAVALVGELHYTATVNEADTVNAGPFLLGNSGYDLSLLNGMFGGHLRFGNSTLTGGYAVPLTSSDRVFDGELRMFINRFF